MKKCWKRKTSYSTQNVKREMESTFVIWFTVFCPPSQTIQRQGTKSQKQKWRVKEGTGKTKLRVQENCSFLPAHRRSTVQKERRIYSMNPNGLSLNFLWQNPGQSLLGYWVCWLVTDSLLCWTLPVFRQPCPRRHIRLPCFRMISAPTILVRSYLPLKDQTTWPWGKRKTKLSSIWTALWFLFQAYELIARKANN